MSSQMSPLDIDRLTAEVEREIASHEVTPLSAPHPSPSANPFEDAAAVLVTFDPSSLRPYPNGGPPTGADAEAMMEQLSMSSRVVVDASGRRQWSLRSSRRIECLRRLKERGLLQAAIAANEPSLNDTSQRALTSGLSGHSLPVDNSSIVDLKACLQVAQWLDAAGIRTKPSPEELSSRIEWRTLLHPFEHIAGEHFRGRETELEDLRAFANVVPPKSALEGGMRLAGRAAAAVTGLLSRSSRSALMVSGPGGVGKSTLLARFILEHAQALEEDRFPFAYLDFDRPDVAADEPLTLLTEAVRQLGIEYPEVRPQCERLRQGWLAQLAEREQKSGATPVVSLTHVRTAAVRDAVHAIRGLAGGTRPILMVLDTFEEVMFRGDHAVEAIWNMLVDLRNQLPALRIVIVGRVEFQQPGVRSLQLSTFDQPAAIAYLASRGVRDEALAKEIVRLFGGSPLTLKLAAELASHDGTMQRLEGVSTQDSFLRRLNDEHIQRQLYKRVLTHIHDPQVRRLAHPGLLLRRITPEAILHVLAEPCGVDVPDLSHARALFAELRREASLVSTEPDGSLRHRQDLRCLMLEALQRDQPAKTADINRRAVEFYQSRVGDADRAEEIYHRLWRDEPLDQIAARWKRGVRRRLQNAMQEFDAPRRAFLAAMLDVPADQEARQAARLADWEAIAARQAHDLLQDDDVAGAIGLIGERSRRTIDSPVVTVHAKALLRLDRFDEAVGLLNRACAQALQADHKTAATRFALGIGEAVAQRAVGRYAKLALSRLQWVSANATTVLDRITARALFAFAAELEGAGDHFSANERELNRLIAGVSRRTLARAPAAAYWAAAAPGRLSEERLVAIVAAVGVPRASDTRMRQLAFALGRVDIVYSSHNGLEPGALAKRHRVPLERSITESWSRYVVDASSAHLKSCVQSILELGRLDGARDAVEAAVRGIMCEEVGIAETALSGNGSIVSAPKADTEKGVALEASLRSSLLDAIAAAFTLDDLGATLRRRLSRVIEAYSSAATLREAAAMVAESATRGGWLLELVAALADARPEDLRLAAAGHALGLSNLTGDPSLSARLREKVGADATQLFDVEWMRRLSHIEHCTCIVEADGAVCGTGFLVSADLILTARQVLEQANVISPRTICFRFDHRSLRDGTPIREGTVFRCLGEVATGTVSNHYALLRADASPGAQPVGGSSTESSAGIRRWLQLPRLVRLQPDMSLIVFSHSPRRTLHASTGSVLGTDPFSYVADDPALCAGGPCYDVRRLRLVGVNLNRPHGNATAAMRIDTITQQVGILRLETDSVDPTWSRFS